MLTNLDNFFTFFIQVQFQAPQRVTVGIDLTVDTIHLDELDNNLGINFHIKVNVAIIISNEILD